MLKLAAGLVFSLSVIQPAIAADNRVAAGILNCDMSSEIAAIVGGQEELSCVFEPSSPGPSETYQGKITEFGLDVGEVEAGKLSWLVYNVTNAPLGGLQGTYRGVVADASLGLGAGAMILSQVDRKTVSLQPLSVEGEEGLNLAVGVVSMTLTKSD